MINDKCITGYSPTGHCVAAYPCGQPYDCCLQCEKDCNSRCGWIEKAGKSEGGKKPEREGEQTKIVMLPVDKLHLHPDNPRKDVGDVSELAESIRANGILQNLTVVISEDGGYTVIIGHRRLAAANKAGLTKVPCVIAEMTEKEQISTMLTENMQRSDLTVYEQAKAFQQLELDLGMSVSEIAEMSGFSETTVRRRTKLAELDGKAFKKACDRGATLFDFAELDKIDDPADKAKCLEAMGTSNFRNELKSALDRQKKRQSVAKYEAQVSGFAEKICKVDYIGGKPETVIGGKIIPMDYVRNYHCYGGDVPVEIPEDAGTVRYFYKKSDSQVDIYRERIKSSAEEEEKRKKEEIRRQDEDAWFRMEEITERHRELREEFILGFGGAKSNMPVIMRSLADALTIEATKYRFTADNDDLCELLRIGYDDETELPEKLDFDRVKRATPERLMLIMTYWIMENSFGYAEKAWDSGTQRYFTRYRKNDRLDALYSFLGELGYEMSDEEWQISTGTHKLFLKEERP